MSATVYFPLPTSRLPESVRITHSKLGYQVMGYWENAGSDLIQSTYTRWEALLTSAAWKGLSKESIQTLAGYPPSVKVHELYDTVPEIAGALVSLVPDFEYPDWSHQTLLDALALIVSKH